MNFQQLMHCKTSWWIHITKKIIMDLFTIKAEFISSDILKIFDKVQVNPINSHYYENTSLWSKLNLILTINVITTNTYNTVNWNTNPEHPAISCRHMANGIRAVLFSLAQRHFAKPKRCRYLLPVTATVPQFYLMRLCSSCSIHACLA